MKKFFALTLVLLCFAGLRGGEAEHLKAAEEMMLAEGVPEMLKSAFSAQLENQFKALPELEKLRPALTRFYETAFSYEELKPELAKIYMKFYTEEEMRRIIAFYRTPAGRKKAAVAGKLSRETGALFLRHSQKKMPELQKILEKYAR